jgi:hypothetical protein
MNNTKIVPARIGTADDTLVWPTIDEGIDGGEYADGVDDRGDDDEGKGNAKTDPLKAMKGAWRSASKAECGAFLDWVCGRGSGLPKGDARTLVETVARLKRLLKSNSSLHNHAMAELREILGER